MTLPRRRSCRQAAQPRGPSQTYSTHRNLGRRALAEWTPSARMWWHWRPPYYREGGRLPHKAHRHPNPPHSTAQMGQGKQNSGPPRTPSQWHPKCEDLLQIPAPQNLLPPHHFSTDCVTSIVSVGNFGSQFSQGSFSPEKLKMNLKLNLKSWMWRLLFSSMPTSSEDCWEAIPRELPIATPYLVRSIPPLLPSTLNHEP